LVPSRVGPDFVVQTVATLTDFLGYAEPVRGSEVRGTDARGRPLKGVPARPRLRVREAAATARCRPGEVIVLRGPQSPQVVRTSDRVPGLSRVPLLGRLFRKEGVQTNLTRLYVIIEPMEPSAGK
jgi:Flp pilus assembly secretin CpaC